MNSDYTGPCLEGDITTEFMKELISFFKDQKILHIKYAYKVIEFFLDKNLLDNA